MFFKITSVSLGLARYFFYFCIPLRRRRMSYLLRMASLKDQLQRKVLINNDLRNRHKYFQILFEKNEKDFYLCIPLRKKGRSEK